MSLVRDKFMALVCAAGATAFLAACPGGDDAPDARVQNVFDADNGPPVDAGLDADMTPDAAPILPSGSIAVSEVNINGVPQAGQGLQISINFEDETYPQPALVVGNTADGCSVWEYTAAESAVLSLDEGALTITSADATPVVPNCAFVPTQGYRCFGGMGAGMVSVVDDADAGGAIPAGTALVTVTTATFTAADVGRYINIMGATAAANNGTFPIVGLGAAAGQVVVANPVAATQAVPSAGGYAVIAGLGPVPGVADPGFLEDDDNLTIALTPGGAMDFDAFSVSFAAGGAADDFTLDTASQGVISGIPVDGTAFTVGCGGAGGTCGTALGQILVLTMTDGALPASPFTLGPVVTKKVIVRCTKIGGTAITVPANVSAFIMNSGATRIQSLFLRANLQSATSASGAGINIVTGHGTVGFTTVP